MDRAPFLCTDSRERARPHVGNKVIRTDREGPFECQFPGLVVGRASAGRSERGMPHQFQVRIACPAAEATTKDPSIPSRWNETRFYAEEIIAP